MFKKKINFKKVLFKDGVFWGVLKANLKVTD